MTVNELLKHEGLELDDVQVLDLKWYCSMVDKRKEDCGCLNLEVAKYNRERKIIYVL